MSEISIREINERVKADPKALIRDSEMGYRTALDQLADRMAEELGVSVLLLAGPSGAGKTTTANLLADKIRARGDTCVVVSLDNFYRASSDPLYPRLPSGERDMECAEALKLDDIGACVEDILMGRSFVIPKYDFTVAAPTDTPTVYAPMHEGCVILEGLHALNPRITENVTGQVHKMFVSLSTNVEEGGVRLLSGRKARFVRRLVRDSIFRGAAPERTASVWQSVLDGEDKYLYPYKSTADIFVNTFHPFELSCERELALPLLAPLAEDYRFAHDAYETLKRIEPMDPALVPADSLIREFIGGGIYDD